MSSQEQEPKLGPYSLEHHRLDQLGFGLRNLIFARTRMEAPVETERVFFQPSAPAGPIEEAAPIDDLAALRQQIEREAA